MLVITPCIPEGFSKIIPDPSIPITFLFHDMFPSSDNMQSATPQNGYQIESSEENGIQIRVHAAPTPPPFNILARSCDAIHEF